MKSTKKQASAIYDSFFNTLRNLNGGTAEENKRMAPRCLERLTEHAAVAAAIAANPNKHLSNDDWLFEAISITIPARVKSFASRYSL